MTADCRSRYLSTYHVGPHPRPGSFKALVTSKGSTISPTATLLGFVGICWSKDRTAITRVPIHLLLPEYEYSTLWVRIGCSAQGFVGDMPGGMISLWDLGS